MTAQEALDLLSQSEARRKVELELELARKNTKLAVEKYEKDTFEIPVILLDFDRGVFKNPTNRQTTLHIKYDLYVATELQRILTERGFTVKVEKKIEPPNGWDNTPGYEYWTLTISW